MHISFILPSLWLSGGVRVVVEYANRLTERGHRITLVAPGGTLDRDMTIEIVPDVSVHESPAIRRPSMRARDAALLAWSLARAVPPSDVVISTHTSTTVSGFLSTRLLQRGRPVWLYQDYREMFNGRPFEDWLMRHALRWHELALVVSTYSKQELRTYSPGNVMVVGEGLSHPELFQPRQPSTPKKSTERQTILFLGDMRPRKGLFDFLEAAELVHEKLPTIQLLIVSKEQCSINSELPFTFKYRPSRHQLAQMYGTCDLFVSASWWESFGLPPLEAMACGAPVVLTDSRGVREFARPGENCLLVPVRDPTSLAEAMIRVLTDSALSEGLRRMGPKTAARFTWGTATDRLENALEDLLIGRGERKREA